MWAAGVCVHQRVIFVRQKNQPLSLIDRRRSGVMKSSSFRGTRVAFLSLASAASAAVMAASGTPAASTDVTPSQMIDAFEGTFGVHPGQRRNHIKGTCAAGQFTGTTDAATLSRSALFSGRQEIPAPNGPAQIGFDRNIRGREIMNRAADPKSAALLRNGSRLKLSAACALSGRTLSSARRAGCALWALSTDTC